MLTLSFDKSNKRSYAQQIYTDIREKIISGELESGERLPSSRELCRELDIARNTVLTAYEMLVAEGAVTSVAGSGFYVREGVTRRPQRIPMTHAQTASLSDVAVSEGTVNFDSGLPALDLFPREKWNRVVSHAFLDAPISALGYDDPQGRPELRKVLCEYLKRARGLSCTPEQIIVTSGAKQGLSLAAKCLLHADSEVWMENPSNANVTQIFSYYTKNIVPFGVDDQGILPEQFPKRGKPKLIFVTPSHQFPVGGILPIQRRLALVAFAQQSGAYLLEDDYDSEFNYDAPPATSLFALDRERVLYVGTFSKVMFPSLRLGYLVVPAHLVSRVRELKRLADHHSNSITQLALMRFLESGEFARHVRRMKRIYRKRRDLLRDLLPRYFGNRVSISGTAAGMHLIAAFEGVSFPEDRVKRLRQAGVYLVPVSAHSLIQDSHPGQVILGFASLTQEDMERGLALLKEECD